MITLEHAMTSRKAHGARIFEPYGAQREFFALGAEHSARVLSGANRVGKTLTGAQEVAIHCTGEYPEWWTGKRIKGPSTWWVGSTDWATNVEGVQKALVGDIGKGQFGEGFIHKRLNLFVPCAIPKDRIAKTARYQGVDNALASISVRHKDGGLSRIRMVSYAKGRENLQAGGVDGILLDEEPPEDVFSELTLRTFEQGGIVMMTFTPLKGLSTVLKQFIGDVTINKKFPRSLITDAGALIRIPMSDAPHLSATMIAQLKRRLPDHEHMARIEGIPALGAGAIYPFTQEKLQCEHFEIPPHWKVLDAIDFGFNHPTARTRMVLNPDTLEAYLLSGYKASEKTPEQHFKDWTRQFKGRVPVTWPHDGRNTELDGISKLDRYQNLGMLTTVSPAELPTGGNSVEGGLQLCYDAMFADRLKIFPGNHHFFTEQALYRREEKNGVLRVVKEMDDLLDAFRYNYVSLLAGQGVTWSTAMNVQASGAYGHLPSNSYEANPYD